MVIYSNNLYSQIELAMMWRCVSYWYQLLLLSINEKLHFLNAFLARFYSRLTLNLEKQSSKTVVYIIIPGIPYSADMLGSWSWKWLVVSTILIKCPPFDRYMQPVASSTPPPPSGSGRTPPFGPKWGRDMRRLGVQGPLAAVSAFFTMGSLKNVIAPHQ